MHRCAVGEEGRQRGHTTPTHTHAHTQRLQSKNPSRLIPCFFFFSLKKLSRKLESRHRLHCELASHTLRATCYMVSSIFLSGTMSKASFTIVSMQQQHTPPPPPPLAWSGTAPLENCRLDEGRQLPLSQLENGGRRSCCRCRNSTPRLTSASLDASEMRLRLPGHH